MESRLREGCEVERLGKYGLRIVVKSAGGEKNRFSGKVERTENHDTVWGWDFGIWNFKRGSILRDGEAEVMLMGMWCEVVTEALEMRRQRNHEAWCLGVRGVHIGIVATQDYGGVWGLELRQTATSSLLVVGENEQLPLGKRPPSWDMVDSAWGWGYLLRLMTIRGMQTRLSSHPGSPWWLFNW